MQALARVFSLPKSGNAPGEYEDASWPRGPASRHASPLAGGAPFRVAIADGATEASYSDIWAELLVDAYAQGRLGPAALLDDLIPLQNQWRGRVGEKLLPWYAQEKLRLGAFAALAGLSLRENPPPLESAADRATVAAPAGAWEALAVGDSCIFQIRDLNILRAFPIDDVTQFDNRPALIASCFSANQTIAASSHDARGDWSPGDHFLLMTDALACWFLRLWHAEADRDALLQSLFSLDTIEDFTRFIAAARGSGERAGLSETAAMRNDDVTLIVVQFGRDGASCGVPS